MAEAKRESIVFTDAQLMPYVREALNAVRTGNTAALGNLQRHFAARYKRVGDSFFANGTSLKFLHAEQDLSRVALQYLLERACILDNNAVDPSSPWYYFQIATTPDVLTVKDYEEVTTILTIPRLCLADERLNLMKQLSLKILATLRREDLNLQGIEIRFNSNNPLTIKFSARAKTVQETVTQLLQVLMKEGIVSTTNQDHVFDTAREQTDPRVKGRREARFSPQRLSPEARGNTDLVFQCVAEMRKKAPEAGIRARVGADGVVGVSYLLGILTESQLIVLAQEVNLLGAIDVAPKRVWQHLEIPPNMLGKAEEILGPPAQLTIINQRANADFPHSDIRIALGSIGELRVSFMEGSVEPQALLRWFHARQSHKGPFLQPHAEFSAGPAAVELLPSLQVAGREAIVLRIPRTAVPEKMQKRNLLSTVIRRIRATFPEAHLEELPHELRIILSPASCSLPVSEGLQGAIIMLKSSQLLDPDTAQKLRGEVREKLMVTIELSPAQIDFAALQTGNMLQTLRTELSQAFPGRDLKIILGAETLSIQYRNGVVKSSDILGWLQQQYPNLFSVETPDGGDTAAEAETAPSSLQPPEGALAEDSPLLQGEESAGETLLPEEGSAGAPESGDTAAGAETVSFPLQTYDVNLVEDPPLLQGEESTEKTLLSEEGSAEDSTGNYNELDVAALLRQNFSEDSGRNKFKELFKGL